MPEFETPSYCRELHIMNWVLSDPQNHKVGQVYKYLEGTSKLYKQVATFHVTYFCTNTYPCDYLMVRFL